MLKKLIIPFIFLGFNHAWADCDITSKFNINVNVEPVKYNYNYNSVSIKNMPNIKTFNESQYLLGAYIPVLSVGVNSKTFREQSFSGTCYKIAEMNVTLRLESSIYLAREIQPFSCSLNRTINHENTHFRFQKEAVDIGVEYLRKNLEPAFSQKFYGSPQEFDNFIKKQMTIIQNNTLNIIENNARPKHASIDTSANYKAESTVCSNSERDMVARSILATYR